MAREEEQPKQSPRNPKTQPQQVEGANGLISDINMFSPRFKSAAAMAGWDEESLLMASLVVDDTPVRESKHKKHSDLHFKTPPTNSSRRKRRAQRRIPTSIPVAVLNLDDEETTKQESGKLKAKEPQTIVNNETETGGDQMAESSGTSCPPISNLPCLDKLRDELSCAICLDICFEPSTTPCGHSFCKKCLKSAADKCGKRCPKCRQLISNARSCTVNTVLWNTIQLLFPQEVEAKRAAGALNSREAERQNPEKASCNSRSIQSREVTMRRRRVVLIQDEEEEDQNPQQVALRSNHRSFRSARIRDVNVRNGRGIPSQDEDAALALRLQRDEFMEAFRGTHDQSSSSLSSARANLRAMVSRASNRRYL